MRYLFVLLLLTGCDAPGRFQMAQTKGSNFEEERVWVLDTTTGRITLCYYKTSLGCVPEREALSTRWLNELRKR